VDKICWNGQKNDLTGAQKKGSEYEQQEHRVLTSCLRSQKQMSPKTLGLNIVLKMFTLYGDLTLQV
jgi:hypothetical protein